MKYKILIALGVASILLTFAVVMVNRDSKIPHIPSPVVENRQIAVSSTSNVVLHPATMTPAEWVENAYKLNHSWPNRTSVEIAELLSDCKLDAVVLTPHSSGLILARTTEGVELQSNDGLNFGKVYEAADHIPQHCVGQVVIKKIPFHPPCPTHDCI